MYNATMIVNEDRESEKSFSSQFFCEHLPVREQLQDRQVQKLKLSNVESVRKA